MGRGGPRIVDPCQPTAIEEEMAGACCCPLWEEMRRGKLEREVGWCRDAFRGLEFCYVGFGHL